MLEELGAHVLDADLAAREVLAGQAARDELVCAFGESVLHPDGTVDRRRLAELVFHDDRARERLNAITHPRILRLLREQLLKLMHAGAQVVVLEAALLVETGLTALVDEVWVVAVEPRVQLERLALRDGLSGEQARARLAAQLPLGEKVKVAHVVIDNNGNLAATRQQVAREWARLLAGDRPPARAVERWLTRELGA